MKSHPGLKKHFKTIKDKFNIDWQTVKWENLRKPLYSAIAARLYYINKPEPIPKDLKKQAEYWKKYYNSEDKNAKGSAKKFLERVKAAGKTERQIALASSIFNQWPMIMHLSAPCPGVGPRDTPGIRRDLVDFGLEFLPGG